jgi:hypothetical protein
MTPFEYIRRGLPVFPCRANGGPRLRKTPLTPNGFKDATIDPAIVQRWFERYPTALWGMPTGPASGIVALDVDTKNSQANGFDTLEDIGRSILPETPMVHTESGGVHVYFQAPERDARNSAGKIGPGLDVRACGGYVIIPTDGSGYSWDPHWNLDTTQPVEAPNWLWPRPPARPRTSAQPIKSVEGLSPYAEAAIESACTAIAGAGPGQQECTLNAEAFSIGALAGAQIVPADIALRALMRAAGSMPDYDAAWPWRPEEIDHKVKRAFADGLRHPREVRRVMA